MLKNQSAWFRISEIKPEIFRIEEPGHVCSFLVNGEHTSAVIDTGMGFADLFAVLKPRLKKNVIVLNTHWHFDHIGGNAAFPQRGIARLESHRIEKDYVNTWLQKLYMEQCVSEGLDFPAGFSPRRYAVKGARATFFIAHGDRFDLGHRCLEAISTPGHTHGSISFLDHPTGSLFCGDVIYHGTLYLHLDESDFSTYLNTLRNLLHRGRQIQRLYPAHNDAETDMDFVSHLYEKARYFHRNPHLAVPVEIWGQRVNCFESEQFRILTKPPGSAGIAIIPPTPFCLTQNPCNVTR